MYRWTTANGKSGICDSLDQAYRDAQDAYGSRLWWWSDDGDEGAPSAEQLARCSGACGYRTSDEMDDRTVARVEVHQVVAAH